VQNDVTIRLNRSIERKYKRTNSKHTKQWSVKKPALVPHDNSWKFKRAYLALTCANLQLQCCQNY